MKKWSFLCSIICFCSCATNVGTGILTGAALGAGSGGLVSGPGALIGSAVGIVSGGLIGTALDAQDRRVMEKSSPRTVDRMDRRDPLTLNDVIKLSLAEVSDETIISYMQETGSTYNLSQSQIRRLHDSGVSKRVLDYMIASGTNY
jgi:uncharacterized protein YcfJ